MKINQKGVPIMGNAVLASTSRLTRMLFETLRIKTHSRAVYACQLKRAFALLSIGSTILCASVQARDIAIAQIGPFTGLPSPDAHEVYAGAMAYFAKVNAQGGVNGNKLTLTKFDDRFDGNEFVNQLSAVRREQKYVALLSPIGVLGIVRMLQENLLSDAGLIVINVIPGIESFRKANNPYVFHVRAGDEAQIERIVKHAKLLNIMKLAVLQQEIASGPEWTASVKSSAERLGGFQIKVVVAKHDDGALAAAGGEISKLTDSQAVVILGTPKFIADGVASTRKAGIKQQIYTMSYAPPGLVVKVAGEAQARGVGIVQTFPSPNGRVSQVQRDFQSAMKAHMPEVKQYSFFHFEGYLSARVLAEAIRRAGGRTDPESLSRAMRTASPMDFNGFIADFRKSNAGSQWTDMSVISRNGALLY